MPSILNFGFNTTTADTAAADAAVETAAAATTCGPGQDAALLHDHVHSDAAAVVGSANSSSNMDDVGLLQTVAVYRLVAGPPALRAGSTVIDGDVDNDDAAFSDAVHSGSESDTVHHQHQHQHQHTLPHLSLHNRQAECCDAISAHTGCSIPCLAEIKGVCAIRRPHQA